LEGSPFQDAEWLLRIIFANEVIQAMGSDLRSELEGCLAVETVQSFVGCNYSDTARELFVVASSTGEVGFDNMGLLQSDGDIHHNCRATGEPSSLCPINPDRGCRTSHHHQQWLPI
jgi:hypothetical protein